MAERNLLNEAETMRSSFKREWRPDGGASVLESQFLGNVARIWPTSESSGRRANVDRRRGDAG